MSRIYLNVLRLLALVLAGLALVRPVMDLAALSTVVNLPKDDYAEVQSINRSFVWLEYVRLASFFSIVGLFILERGKNPVFWPIRGAFIAQLLVLILYVAFTIPINISTFNWTFFPDSNWSWLRVEWEYAGAVSTIIGAIAFVLLLLDLVYAKWR